MRRRPGEDDEEQRNGAEVDRARHRHPPDHRREGARRTADHDVLRRQALQPHGVDDDVEENREGQERAGQHVDHQAQHQHRARGQHHAEAQRFRRRDGARRNRALRGALHHRVDVGVIPHVESTGRTGTDRNRQQRHESEPWMERPGCRDDADEGGEDDERHDPRLQQGEEVLHRALAARDGGLGFGDMGVDVAHRGCVT